jgi:cytochrome c-type biogenesis protein CcmH
VSSNWVFWAVAAAFVVLALALILPPLLRRRPAPVKTGRRNINIAVYRDQLKEMENDRNNGLISDDQFAAAKIELEARLAQDAVESEDIQPASRGGRKLGFGLAVLLPVAAFAMYVVMGNPMALNGAVPAGPMGFWNGGRTPYAPTTISSG